MGFKDFLKNNWKDIADVGLGVVGAAGQGKQQGRSNDLQDKAIEFEREKYADASPFRQMALNGINAANAPVNSASVFRDPNNPFSASYNYDQDLGANRIADVSTETIPDGYQVDPSLKPPPVLRPTEPLNGNFGAQPIDDYGQWAAENRRRVSRPLPSGGGGGGGGGESPDPATVQAMMQDQFLERYRGQRQRGAL